MPAKVWITDEDMELAMAVERKAMRGELTGPGCGSAQNAAANIIRFRMTQDRYHLEPKTPAQFEEDTAGNPARNKEEGRYNADELARLTPEQLLDYQRKLLLGRPKQKPEA